MRTPPRRPDSQTDYSEARSLVAYSRAVNETTRTMARLVPISLTGNLLNRSVVAKRVVARRILLPPTRR